MARDSMYTINIINHNFIQSFFFFFFCFRRYMLQPRNVIPIPDEDEAKGLLELNPGQDVLALYPGTTCFYRAKVIAAPSKVVLYLLCKEYFVLTFNILFL